jgi:predicted DNA-binding ribbon-helix-helix protein
MGSSEMGLFRNLERRHVGAGDGRTTIALEPEFWQAADMQAKAKGMDWRQWAAGQLEGRPDSYGRASWLRVAILKGAG